MAEITYSQEYFNEENNPVEIKYNFPSDYEYAVTQIAAKIDDKEIKTEIMEKKEAAEKYDDAIASGNTGIMAKIDEKLPDVIDLAIGQLQPGKTVLIEIKIVTQLKAVSKRFYNFVFPMHFIPKYGGSSVKVEGSKIPGQFSMDVKIEAARPIDNIHTNIDFDVTEPSNEEKTYTLTMADKHDQKA